MYDPNGIQVEITIKDARYDAILAEDTANAHRILQEWTAKTRATKIERCGQDMIDIRGVDFSKVDTSNVKVDIRAHHKPDGQE